jgi:hypothetical protein
MKNILLISLIILFSKCSNDVGRFELITQFGYADLGNGLEIYDDKDYSFCPVAFNVFYYQEAKENLGEIDTNGFIVVLLDNKTGDLVYKQFGVKGVLYN